jgi:hypothetical protein
MQRALRAACAQSSIGKYHGRMTGIVRHVTSSTARNGARAKCSVVLWLVSCFPAADHATSLPSVKPASATASREPLLQDQDRLVKPVPLRPQLGEHCPDVSSWRIPVCELPNQDRARDVHAPYFPTG